MDIIDSIRNVSNNLKWQDIERFCSARNYEIMKAKSGYKVMVGNSVWTVHLVHNTKKLKRGIVARFKKILEKENVI